MSAWPLVALGDLLTHTPRPLRPGANEVCHEVGIRSHGRGIFHKPPTTGAEIGNKKVFRIEPGDFIVNIVFAWEGAVAMAGEPERGTIASHRFPTFRAKPDRLDPRFLLHYLRTKLGRELLGRVSPGGAGRNRTLNRGAFLAQRIPVPAVREQGRIVETIEALESRLDEATRMGALAGQDSSNLLVVMAHRPDLIDDAKRDQGWTRVRFGEILRPFEDAVEVDAAVSYPNIGIYSFARGVFGKPPIDGSATSARKLYRVRAGQFIFSRLFAFEGAYAVVPEAFDGCFVSNEYPSFECVAERVLPEFLAAYFRSPQAWRAVAHGSKGLGNRRQRVHPPQILAHETWLPPLSRQLQLRAAYGSITSLALLRQRATLELSGTLASLLQRCFSQTAAVPNA